MHGKHKVMGSNLLGPTFYMLVWIHLYYWQKRNHKTKTVVRAKNIKQQKYPIALIKNSTKRALQIPLNKLRIPQEKETEEICPSSSHNPNNHIIFPIIRQTF